METRGWTFSRDLEAVIDLARDDLLGLDGGRLFITGGTGFIGCWLLECLRHAEQTSRAAAASDDPDPKRRRLHEEGSPPRRASRLHLSDRRRLELRLSGWRVHACRSRGRRREREAQRRGSAADVRQRHRRHASGAGFRGRQQSAAFSSTQLRRGIWPSTLGHDSCRRAMDGRAGLRRSGEFIRGGQARR